MQIKQCLASCKTGYNLASSCVALSALQDRKCTAQAGATDLVTAPTDELCISNFNAHHKSDGQGGWGHGEQRRAGGGGVRQGHSNTQRLKEHGKFTWHSLREAAPFFSTL